MLVRHKWRAPVMISAFEHSYQGIPVAGLLPERGALCVPLRPRTCA